MTRTSDFAYDLPEHLIAQHPLERRDASRLMTLDGPSGAIGHRHFSELPKLLQAGDCLVLNDSRVIPARLIGQRENGEPAEILLLRRIDETRWETIVRPGRRLREGRRVVFLPGRLSAEIEEILPDGNRLVRFTFTGIWEQVLAEAGTMPLPPYIHEKLQDPSRYQTVYAVHDGSSAAPTAGLHFTPELLRQLTDQGIHTARLTLHVGLGTFRPVQTEEIEAHHMHREWYNLPAEAVDTINESRRQGGRIIAVGTTSCRTLETVAGQPGGLQAGSGETNIFIYPGYRFRLIDGLLTNFHLPESTLLMLVSAFAGRTEVLAAYREAIQNNYRFFSFGDAMLIWRKESL